MRCLSFNEKRAVAVVALAFMVFSSANYLLHLHVFGRASKAVIVLSYVLGYVELVSIGPTVDEIRAYRAKQRKDQPRSSE